MEHDELRQEVNGVYEELFKRFNPFHNEVRARKDVRLGRDTAGLPAKYRTTVPTEYATTTMKHHSMKLDENLTRAVGLMNRTFPSLVVHPVSLNQEDRKKASVMERHGIGGLRELERLNAVQDRVSDSLASHGVAVKKFHPRRTQFGQRYAEYIKQLQEKQVSKEEFDNRTEEFKKAVPLNAVFRYDHVPIETVMFEEDDEGLAVVIEDKEVSAVRLMRTYDLPRSRLEDVAARAGWREGELPWGQTVRVLEYTTREVKAVLLLKGKAQAPDLITESEWEHHWGHTGYFLGEAVRRDEFDPLYRWAPLSSGMYQATAEVSRFRTMLSNIAYYTGWPFWYIRDPGTGQFLLDDEGKPKRYTLTPGPSQIPVLSGDLMQVIPGTGQPLREIMALAQADLDEFALSPILSGAPPGATASGYMTNLVRFLAETAMDPATRARAEMLRQMFEFWFWSMQHVIMETVYVHGLQFRQRGEKRLPMAELLPLSPEDIVTSIFQVVIDPKLPTDQITMAQAGADLVERRMISTRQGREEWLGDPAPEETQFEIDVEEAVELTRPVMVQNLGRRLAARAGLMEMQPPEAEGDRFQRAQLAAESRRKRTGGANRRRGRRPVVPGVGEEEVPTPPEEAEVPPPGP